MPDSAIFPNNINFDRILMRGTVQSSFVALHIFSVGLRSIVIYQLDIPCFVNVLITINIQKCLI